MNSPVFVVIGGGIVGASAAYHLARDGQRTLLIDREDAGHATFAGAGIISPGTSKHADPAFLSLARHAMPYYPRLVDQLRELDAGDTGFAICGEIFMAEDEAEAAELTETLDMLQARHDDGFPALGGLEMIDNARAKALFPAIRDIPAGILVPEAARVDGDRLRASLLAGAQALGAEMRTGDASLWIDGGRVVGVELDGERIAADSVVIAAGTWSNALLEPLSTSLPLAPQKGQILHFRVEEQDTTDWPVLIGFGDQYVLAFGPDRVVAGATRETGSGFDLRVTPGGIKHVLDHALRVAPGLANATLAEIRVGLRPFSDDRLPFIDRIAGAENVVICTGHGPSGLQLGPYSGLAAAQLAVGHAPEADLTPYRLGRPVDSTN